jgi:hypothetical protein
MHSTGRGLAGQSFKIAQVSANPERETVSIKYSRAVRDTAELSAELLLLESQSTVDLLAVNGLSKVISAGLPTLGRR